MTHALNATFYEFVSIEIRKKAPEKTGEEEDHISIDT